MASRRKGPGLPNYCKERFEAFEKNAREVCRNTHDPVTDIPGVKKPNPADPCLHGGPCITGIEAYNYCLDHPDQYGCSFVLAYTPPEIEGGKWTPPSDDVDDVDDTENTDDNTETVPTDSNLPTNITIDGCPEGQVKYDISVSVPGMLNLADISLPCTPISTFCQSFPDLCNDLGQIIDVTDGVVDEVINNGTGLDSDFDINCKLIDRQDGDEPGTCGECRPGYKPDNTKLSPFDGITPCVKIEDRIYENPDCVGLHRETEEDGRCGNCKPGYELDGDKCVKINNTITLGTGNGNGNGNGTGSGTDDGNGNGGGSTPSLSCSEQFRKVAQVIEWGGSDSPATEVCGGCLDSYHEDGFGNCIPDMNEDACDDIDCTDEANANHFCCEPPDPCADVDCTDEANANNTCCTDGGTTIETKCSGLNRQLPIWAGSVSHECGPCLAGFKDDEFSPPGSACIPIEGWDTSCDNPVYAALAPECQEGPGLGTGAGAGTGSITEGMFKKYLPEFQPINSELLGRAPSYSRGMNMEGLFKGFF